MKTAQEWQDELAGETSLQSIAAIQLDALTHAARMVTAHADSPARGFMAIHKLIAKLGEAQSSNDLRERPAHGDSRQPKTL